MIKRIIFDIDNTLIAWNSTSWDFLPNYLKSKNYPHDEDTLRSLTRIINSYILEDKIITKEDYMSKLAKEFNLNFTEEELNEILVEHALQNIHEPNEEQIKVMQYLKEKYEIYALTNWFEEFQMFRLEKIGILKYFDKVVGFDNYYPKPSPKAFERVCQGLDASECMMIGDNEKFDIEPALNVGMSAIKLDLLGRASINENIVFISDIKKLKELL